jgi:hypothetical protein
MRSFRSHLSQRSLCVFAVFVFSMLGKTPASAEPVTWQILPFYQSDWLGSQGSPATTNGDVISLHGQPVRTVQSFSGGSLKISYDVMLSARDSTDGTLQFAFVPSGLASNSIHPGMALDFSYINGGTDNLAMWNLLSNDGATQLWGDVPFSISAQTVYHHEIIISSLGRLTWIVDNETNSIPSGITIPFPSYQLELQGWQPGGPTWTITNFDVSAFVEAPNGLVSYGFTTPPLWDASGVYTNTNTSSAVIEDIIQGANGKISGVRTESYINGYDRADASGAITGKTFVKAGQVGARLNIAGGTSAIYQGSYYTGGYSGNTTITINPSSLTVFDTSTMHRLDLNGKYVTRTSANALPLPAGMNGYWRLDLDVAAEGDDLTGTGTITLSNGRVLDYEMIGKYNAKRQSAKLKLIGRNEGAGSSLSLVVQGAHMELVSLKGNVLGQKLALP